MTKIISGFPGVGKSYLYRKSDLSIADSDSSDFSWNENGERNKDFPNNYIEHIKSTVDQVDYLLVSSHDVVREALRDHNIKYTIVYPSADLKEEYLERYRKRRSPEGFISFIETNWSKFLTEIHKDMFPHHFVLLKGETLFDVLDQV
ncbi:hypothetical protein [Bacillus sp. Marseille-P3800]|uniref:hypothetical protein n=1 Tax=Bacillus sp. Marseille-P3800 TaxID=2014782 RepID=UPI001C3F2F8D|nr:hypothetical protein [Bacillus sp. Marseille-P3800]